MSVGFRHAACSKNADEPSFDCDPNPRCPQRAAFPNCERRWMCHQSGTPRRLDPTSLAPLGRRGSARRDTGGHRLRWEHQRRHRDDATDRRRRHRNGRTREWRSERGRGGALERRARRCGQRAERRDRRQWRVRNRGIIERRRFRSSRGYDGKWRFERRNGPSAGRSPRGGRALRHDATLVRCGRAEARRTRGAARRLPYSCGVYERRQRTMRRQRSRRVAMHLRRLLQRRGLSRNRRRTERPGRVRLRKRVSIRQQQLSLCRGLPDRRRLRSERLLLADARPLRSVRHESRLLLPHGWRRMHRRRGLRRHARRVLRVVRAQGALGVFDQCLRRMNVRFARLWVFALGGTPLFAVACGGTVSTDTGGNGENKVQRVPAVHRSEATPCDTTRPPSVPVSGSTLWAECTSDADCTAGSNGRCTRVAVSGWECTYDACFSDTDCLDPSADIRICACENGFRSDNNVCLSQGDCHTDSECGEKGYCSPSLGTCGNFSPFEAFYCHTSADECVDDEDCGGSGNTEDSYCAYSTLKGHWACSTSFCAG